MSNSDLMEKIAEFAPDKYEYITKTAEEVNQSPFRDEILTSLGMLIEKANQVVGQLEKTAAFQFGQMGQKALGAMGGGAAAVGGAALSGIAMSLAGDMYDSIRRGITKGRDYRNMLSNNNDLKALPAKQVQKAFSVLHRFNPDYASDPTVAGAFVRRSASFPDDTMFSDPKMLGELIGARKNLNDVKKLPAVPEFRDSRQKSMDMKHKGVDMKHKGLQIKDLEYKNDPDVRAYETEGENMKREHARNEEERRQRKFEWEVTNPKKPHTP